MVLGCGLEPRESEPNHFDLSLASTERMQTAAAYAREHALGEGALILCVGGSSPLYDGLGNNPEEESEGYKIEEGLLQAGLGEVAIKCAGILSDSTIGNFVDAVEEGALVPSDYSREFPLGIVAHPNHYMRARIDARRVGFDRRALRGIYPHEYLENPQGKDGLLHNSVGVVLSSIVYAGVRRGDLATLTQRNDRMMQRLQRLSRGFVSKRSEA